ncbi:MAG: hypothetical protein H0T62_03280 [Parachlamydiaceae bacterium]|nr:hypothetical protein [Parachlamydiaceae bacterium]
MIYFFLILQCILFFFMAFHDWVDVPPFTNLEALRKAHSFKFRLIGSFINASLILTPILVTLLYIASVLPFWARILFILIYGLITVGTITAWWIPYFGGSYWMHGSKAGFEEYRDTHSFLPQRENNVIPNTLHVILHLQVWMCFGLSIYWLSNGGWS